MPSRTAPMTQTHCSVVHKQNLKVKRSLTECQRCTASRDQANYTLVMHRTASGDTGGLHAGIAGWECCQTYKIENAEGIRQ